MLFAGRFHGVPAGRSVVLRPQSGLVKVALRIAAFFVSETEGAAPGRQTQPASRGSLSEHGKQATPFLPGAARAADKGRIDGNGRIRGKAERQKGRSGEGRNDGAERGGSPGNFVFFAPLSRQGNERAIDWRQDIMFYL